MRRLLGQGSVYTIGTALQLSTAALAIPIITRLLGAAEFGTVALALTTQLLLGAVSTLGLGTAILRFFFDRDGELGGDAVARSLVLSTAVVSLVIVSLVTATGFLWAPRLDPHHPEILLIGSMLAFPGAVSGATMALLRAQERPAAFLSVALASSALAQILGIVGLLIEPTPLAYLTGIGLGVSAAAVLGLALTQAMTARPAGGTTLRSALHYSLPTLPNTISIFALAVGDRVVIQIVSGSDAVGKYQVAYAFGSIGIALLTALQNAWLPITFAAADEERWQSLAETTATVVLLTALICGILSLAAGPVLAVVVPRSYAPQLLSEVAAIVALSSVPWAIYLGASQVLFWTKHTRPLVWITPTAAVFNLTLVAVLVPPLGLRGAAGAGLLAVVIQALLTMWVAGRRASVPWERREEFLSYGLAGFCVLIALIVPLGAAGYAVRLAGVALCAVGFMHKVRSAFKMGTGHASSERAASFNGLEGDAAQAELALGSERAAADDVRVVISSGFHRLHLPIAAREASDRKLLALAITSVYPTANVKRLLGRLPKSRQAKLAPLFQRDTGIPQQNLRAIFAPEFLDAVPRRLGRAPRLRVASERANLACWEMYGRAAARVLTKGGHADVFHFRAGFGGASIARAREAGMVPLCDHALVHPSLLEELVENRGRLAGGREIGKPAPQPLPRPSDYLGRAALHDLDSSEFAVVNSDFVKATMITAGWSPDRVYVAYLGIDDQFLGLGEPVPQRAEVRGSRLPLVFASRFETRKGAETVIHALEAASKDIDWQLIIAGPVDPQIRAAHRDFFEREQVSVLGPLRRSEFKREMVAWPIFLFPSYAEGSARAVFEALACGCYAITTPNAGSIVEDGVHGAIVPAGDVAALAKAIVAAGEDRARLAEIGNRNVNVVTQYYRQVDYGDTLARIYADAARRQRDGL